MSRRLHHGTIAIEMDLTEGPRDFDCVLVLLRDHPHWILVRNRDRGGWEFPGGHREGQETWEETARREAREEAGATLLDLQPLALYRLPSGKQTLAITARLESLSELPPGFETLEVRRFLALPEGELSFKDGLYQFLLDQISGGD